MSLSHVCTTAMITLLIFNFSLWQKWLLVWRPLSNNQWSMKTFIVTKKMPVRSKLPPYPGFPLHFQPRKVLHFQKRKLPNIPSDSAKTFSSRPLKKPRAPPTGWSLPIHQTPTIFWDDKKPNPWENPFPVEKGENVGSSPCGHPGECSKPIFLFEVWWVDHWSRQGWPKAHGGGALAEGYPTVPRRWAKEGSWSPSQN